MLTLPYMQTALIAVIALSLATAVLGVLVNLRGLEFVSDGLVHSVFPGLVIGYAVSGTEGLFPGAIVAGLLGAAILTLVSRRGVGADAGTAIVLTSMFSLGVIIVSKQKSYASQLESLLFGRLLTVTQTQLIEIVVMSALAVLLVVATFKEQVFRAFDRGAMAASGRSTLAVEITLNCAIALVVVAGAQAIGNLMILALVIVPAAIARLLTRRLWMLVPVAAVVAVACGVVGIWIGFRLSYDFDLSASPGAILVLVLVAVYLVVITVSSLVSRMRGRRPAPGLAPSAPATPPAPSTGALS